MALPSLGYSLLRTLLAVLCLALALALSACSPRQLIIDGVANELASQGTAPEDDLELAREASAFYLKLSESLLHSSPGNLRLAESVTAGFTQYAFAFVAFEAEKIESRDIRKAQALRERAARLYARAQRHGMAALERSTSAGLQVGLAYWTAAAWGSLIALSKHDPEIVAQLPQVIRLAHQAWEVDPDWGQGALASLMGSLELARPGGLRAEALRYFDRAIALAGEQAAGPLVTKAEAIALPAGDRQGFEQLLQRAITIAAHNPNLQNEAMLARARWLLANADELF
jgi:predicted anti-sigma-YlaC factor YlaD